MNEFWLACNTLQKLWVLFCARKYAKKCKCSTPSNVPCCPLLYKPIYLHIDSTWWMSLHHWNINTLFPKWNEVHCSLVLCKLRKLKWRQDFELFNPLSHAIILDSLQSFKYNEKTDLFKFCFRSYIKNHKIVFFLKTKSFLRFHTPYLQKIKHFNRFYPKTQFNHHQNISWLSRFIQPGSWIIRFLPFRKNIGCSLYLILIFSVITCQRLSIRDQWTRTKMHWDGNSVYIEPWTSFER